MCGAWELAMARRRFEVPISSTILDTSLSLIVSPKRANSVDYRAGFDELQKDEDSMRGLVLLAACAAFLTAHADEGMWTLDNFPSATVKRDFGADITPTWLEHVRLSTIRLTNCTASFVSPEGLILTNHHCVESCLAELSSKDNSLLDRGIETQKRTDERRCSTQLADILVSMEDVTATVAKSVGGLDDKSANDARK